MAKLLIVFLSVFYVSAKAQVTDLPVLESTNGVSKTTMNPKLYPLLLKVHLSNNSTTTSDFKNFIAHLNHFEIFTANNETSGNKLFIKTSAFVDALLYTQINPNTYELINSNQKEYVIIKQNTDKTSVLVYAFTTKLEYEGIEDLKLM